MTAVAERMQVLMPPRPPRRRRFQPVIAGLVVVLLAAAGLLGNQAVRMRAAVDRERESLRNARAVEAAAASALRGVRGATKAADELRAATMASDKQRNVERVQAHAALVRIQQGLGLTKQDLAKAKAAQNQVAQYSAPRDACVRGVRNATTALQRGDSAAAIAALADADAACATALAAVTGARYPYDFPDPSVIEFGGRYYAYSTNSGVGNVQVLVSSDLEKWSIVGDALAALPAWAAPGATWAPAVMVRGPLVLAYYTTRDRVSGLQCISVAAATSPTGPFIDGSAAPLVCQAGGSIDPSPFVDENGAAWLHWKSEAIPAAPTMIWSQPLRDDGLKLAGLPAPLLSPGQSWERGVIEGPSMVRIEGRDYLFYSGGFWTSAGYGQGVAICDSAAGPCRRILSGPVLASAGRVAGPGGGAAFTTPAGDTWLAFHAFTEPNVGYPNSRTLHLASVRIVDGVILVTPQ